MNFRGQIVWAARCVAVFALLASAIAGVAQSTQGTILGTVTDTTGAAVHNATVTITDTDENVSRTVKTDATGNYQALDLTAGNYAVKIEAPGFEAEQQTGMVLVARQQFRLNAKLRPGAVQTKVEVDATSAGVIDTESASISATLNSVDVINLPTNSRASINGTSPLFLIQTLPGVQTDTANNQGQGVAFSVQGGLPSQADTTIDGISAQSTTGNSPLQNAFPSSESVSELRVDGVLNNPEYGQPGEVTFVSKNGTNKLHGAVFLYDQNSALNATPYGASRKLHIRGNNYGVTAGGPVVIPHLYNGHDKTFFFGTYEGFRLPSQEPYQADVPSTLMKQGNFTGVATVVDPFTGTLYPNDTIPINPAAQEFLQFFPDPNIGNPATYTIPTPQNPYNYVTNKDNTYNSDQFDVRIDQYVGQKLLVFGRFTWKNVNQVDPEPLAFPSGSSIGKDRVMVFAANYSFTPKLLNEFRYGFTWDTSGYSNAFNGPAFAASTGLQGLQNLFFNGVSELDFKYLTSFNADRLNENTQSRLEQYNDSLTWVKGRHTMKFGLDIRTLEAITPLGFYGADNYGTFNYAQNQTFTGEEFGDFLEGTPQGTAYDVVTADNDGLDTHYSFYAQDEWKATPRLNIMFGARYDLQPGYHDAHGNIGNFNPAVPLSGEAVYPDGAQSTLNTGYLASFNACPLGSTAGGATVNGAPCTPVVDNSQAGLPSGLRTTNKLRLMPRVGVAYRPFNDEKTVVRGGFAMYDITQLGSTFYSLTGTLQSGTTIYANSETASGPAYSWPQIYAGSGVSSNAAQLGTAYFGTANSIEWKDPYSEQYTLSLDREIAPGYGARISYIGMETHDLVWAPNENDLASESSTVSAYNQPLSARPFPNWGIVNTRSVGANASYHSMQIDVNHRASKGLTFDSTYTLAKNLADNQGPDSGSFAGESGGARASWNGDRSIDFGQVYGTRRNRWNTTLVYQLPVGRGKQFGSQMNRLEDALVGGWQLSSIFLWQSGPFLTPYFSSGEGDPSGTGSGLNENYQGGSYPGRAQHVDRVGAAKPAAQSRYNWIDKASFVCPGDPLWVAGTACTTGSGYNVATGAPNGEAPLPIGRFGDAQVGDVVGPGTVNLSTGLSKSFAFTERVRFRLEGTFTNVLNHTNLGDPELDISQPTFGVITSARGSDFGGSRTGQVSGRLEF
jgi:hypothetical protein